MSYHYEENASAEQNNAEREPRSNQRWIWVVSALLLIIWITSCAPSNVMPRTVAKNTTYPK